MSKEVKKIADYVGANPTALGELLQRAEAYEKLEKLDVVDDRRYVYFRVRPVLAKRLLFPYEVEGYSVDDDKLKLPEGIKAFYHTSSEAWTAKMCLDVLAVGHSKPELDEWHKLHTLVPTNEVMESTHKGFEKHMRRLKQHDSEEEG